MHFGELTAPEQRVLGCLIEKRWTTPDQYPLSLNALRLACNQSTNRDPVTDYDEATRSARRPSGCRATGWRGWRAATAAERSSTATSPRRRSGSSREQLAVLAVLLLRGPQTPGELKARTERMAQIGSLAEVEQVLDATDRAPATRGGSGAGRGRRRIASSSCSVGRTGLRRRLRSRPRPRSRPRRRSRPRPRPRPRRRPPARRAPVQPAPAPPQRDAELLARLEALEADVASLRAELAELLD